MTGSAPRAPRLYFDKMLTEGDRAECWPWPYAGRCGTGRMRYEGKMEAVHLLAWALLRGPIPEGHTIRHRPRKLGTECWNPWHFVTFEGGVAGHLDKAQQREIRAAVERGENRREIAERFDVAYTTINDVMRRARQRGKA